VQRLVVHESAQLGARSVDQAQDRAARTAGEIGDLLGGVAFDTGEVERLAFRRAENAQRLFEHRLVERCLFHIEFRLRDLVERVHDDQTLAPIEIDEAVADGHDQVGQIAQLLLLEHRNDGVVQKILRPARIVGER